MSHDGLAAAAPRRGPLARLPRDTLVGYACLACLALVAGAFVIFASASYDRVLKRGEQQAQDAALFFADHGSRLFEASDLVTREAIAAVEGTAWSELDGSSKAWQSLKRLSDRFPYIDALYLADEGGRIRLSSTGHPPPSHSVADREYFRVHRDGEEGLYVSDLLLNRAVERQGFVLSRRIGDADGSFRGIAASLIDVRYLADFYRSVNLPYAPVISLFRGDFQVLAQYPPDGDGIGPLPGAAALKAALAKPPPAPAKPVAQDDAEDLIVAYAKIANLPLYVGVAIERRVLRSVWLEESRVPGGLATVALAALGALTFLVFRQARRDERAKRLLESEVEERTADLRNANTQLEMLVQEVHHRVKNNLQVISSMLRLQSIQVADASVRKALLDSVNRVHAMSLVHEMLSSSGDRAGLDFRQYLQDLTDQLRESYGAAERVAVDLACDDLQFDMSRSILLALVVNEIFTNALKHGFRGERSGTLSIALRRNGPRATLSITDDGYGLPPGFDWRKANSLGLQIVQSLTAKLGGEAALSSGERTRFTLTFPLRNAAFAATTPLPDHLVAGI
ncbi:sensor histidine kinase [Azospirillum sp. ST 5-10]|uniref:sensor histidine kinase n=1 Tax=unclassified Azospirillum TaxID=2630922 RepID=UPI003F49E2D8